ncbi:hypothetical protein GmRootA79_32180 [Acidovorax sp. A79]
MAREESRQIARQVTADGIVVGEQGDVASNSISEWRQVGMHLFELGNTPAGVFQHDGSSRREFHSAGMAFEEWCPDGFLKLPEA